MAFTDIYRKGLETPLVDSIPRKGIDALRNMSTVHTCDTCLESSMADCSLIIDSDGFGKEVHRATATRPSAYVRAESVRFEEQEDVFLAVNHSRTDHKKPAGLDVVIVRMLRVATFVYDAALPIVLTEETALIFVRVCVRLHKYCDLEKHFRYFWICKSGGQTFQFGIIVFEGRKVSSTRFHTRDRLQPNLCFLEEAKTPFSMFEVLSIDVPWIWLRRT
jgi:hypothetical protein